MREEHEIIVRSRHEVVALPGISLPELARLCDCQLAVARLLVEIGLLEPICAGAEPLFSSWSVVRLRKALRLRRDLHLNFDAVALVMGLLDRIEELERGR